MDPILEADILKTCECIGFADEAKGYIAEPEWQVCVNDLLKYLKRDDDDQSNRRLLGKAQVLGRDLLPLFKSYPKEVDTWVGLLRLLATLTAPAIIVYQDEIPKNKKYLNFYNEVDRYLRTYKEAFVDKGVWKTLADKLRALLDMDWTERLEQHILMIARILYVARNILHVSADPREERRADDDTSLHDRILMVMHLSGFNDVLLLAATANVSYETSILVLEITSLMLREQTGEQLAKTQLARNEDDKVKDERELIRMREREAVLKNIQLQKVPTRHSRFGGTFVVRDMKAPSGRDILCHKPITSVADLSLDSQKKRKKVASNRKVINEEDSTRRSTLSIRIVLKDYCASFLKGSYNYLMGTVKDSLNRGSQDNDETYYLLALKFFMEFNRHHQFRLAYVKDTMSTNTFHYVQTLLDRYQGMMVTDKEKIPLWSKRAHSALEAYQELLFTLMWMDKDGDESVRDASRSIKRNVFYLPEYRELCLGLLTTYDPVKLSKLYLRDLIETNHLFLKMLEDYSTKNRRVMIKCKGKKRKSKKDLKKKKNAPKRGKKSTMSPAELEESWATISGDILEALIPSSSGLPDGEEDAAASSNENVIPFDAASDVPIDDQKETAVQRIAVFLHTGKFKEAALLLRGSREVWPTDPEYFGESNCEPMDEVVFLKSIYMEKASLPAVLDARFAAENGENDETGDLSSRVDTIDEDDREKAAVIGLDDDNQSGGRSEEDEEEEREEEDRSAEKEEEFDFRGFVLKYAMGRVVANYALLFKDWDSLKPLTLHCIIKMFHRFVFDMGYPALICQASLFLTFQKLLQVADHRSDLKEAKGFFMHFWPKFASLAGSDKKMFVEILYWKTAREAQEIQDGYAELKGGEGSGTGKRRKPKKSDWTKEEETELELLVELYQDSPEEVKKAQKLIDFIMERWTWRPRSKRMFIKKLQEKELVDPAEFTKKTTRKKKLKPWQIPEGNEELPSVSSTDDEGDSNKTRVPERRASSRSSSSSSSSSDSEDDSSGRAKQTENSSSPKSAVVRDDEDEDKEGRDEAVTAQRITSEKSSSSSSSSSDNEDDSSRRAKKTKGGSQKSSIVNGDDESRDKTSQVSSGKKIASSSSSSSSSSSDSEDENATAKLAKAGSQKSSVANGDDEESRDKISRISKNKNKKRISLRSSSSSSDSEDESGATTKRPKGSSQKSSIVNDESWDKTSKVSSDKKIASSSSSSSSSSSDSEDEIGATTKRSKGSSQKSSVVNGDDDESRDKISQQSNKEKVAPANDSASDSDEENIRTVKKKKRAIIIDSDDE